MLTNREELNTFFDNHSLAENKGLTNFTREQVIEMDITPHYPLQVDLRSGEIHYSDMAVIDRITHIDNWALDQLQGRYIVYVDYGYFELEEDAVLFKMTWWRDERL